MSRAKKVVPAAPKKMSPERARIIGALVLDLDTVDDLLLQLRAEEWDEVRFGVGVAYAGHQAMHRAIGPFNLSTLALRSMLEYARRDIRQALQKFNVDIPQPPKKAKVEK